MENEQSKIIKQYEKTIEGLIDRLERTSEFYKKEYQDQPDYYFLKYKSEAYKQSAEMVDEEIKILNHVINTMGWKK